MPNTLLTPSSLHKAPVVHQNLQKQRHIMANYRALTSTPNLSNTSVVILGGTSGIGAAIAVRFAALGASVLVMGRTEAADAVREMQSALGDGTGATLSYGHADLSAVAGIRSAADDIAAWAGPKGVRYLIQSQGPSFSPVNHTSADTF